MKDAFSTRGPRAAQRRARHLGPDHDPRPHQPRLRRRADDHERGGRRADGNGHRPRARRARSTRRRAAISSPLLEDLSIEGARGVLINITGGSDMTLYEVNEASSLIHEAAHEDANIIVGAVIDETMREDEMRVTVIATGLDGQEMRRMPPPSRRRTTEPTYEIERERAMVEAPNVTPIREAQARSDGAARPVARRASARTSSTSSRRRRRQTTSRSPTAARRRRIWRRAGWAASSRPSRTSSRPRPSCARAASDRSCAAAATERL